MAFLCTNGQRSGIHICQGIYIKLHNILLLLGHRGEDPLKILAAGFKGFPKPSVLFIVQNLPQRLKYNFILIKYHTITSKWKEYIDFRTYSPKSQ